MLLEPLSITCALAESQSLGVYLAGDYAASSPVPYSDFPFSLLLLRPSVKLLLYPAYFQPLPSDVHICLFVQQLTAFPMSEHPIVVQILKSNFSFFRIS